MPKPWPPLTRTMHRSGERKRDGMAEKIQPLGICDLCLGPIKDPYTSKGKPRRYCSRECMNTANSRAGALERSRKAKERIAKGLWVNPHTIRPPTSEEQASRARKGYQRRVTEGRWHNPGQTPEARAINSLPHKHSGALAEAMEKLKHGKMADLTPEQADAYRAYAREKTKALHDSWSDEERAKRREKWSEYARQAYWRQKGKGQNNANT